MEDAGTVVNAWWVVVSALNVVVLVGVVLLLARLTRWILEVRRRAAEAARSVESTPTDSPPEPPGPISR